MRDIRTTEILTTPMRDWRKTAADMSRKELRHYHIRFMHICGQCQAHNDRRAFGKAARRWKVIRDRLGGPA